MIHNETIMKLLLGLSVLVLTAYVLAVGTIIWALIELTLWVVG
jgi:hypothetical protein